MSTPELSLEEDDAKQLKPDSGVSVSNQSRVGSLLLAERRALEMIAEGASLTDVLKGLCAAIDAQSPEIMSTIMLTDADGKRLWPIAGPRVPKAWLQAVAPLDVGPGIGSCSTAAFHKKLVIVPDIASDPFWSGTLAEDYRKIALSHGLRAAWSRPLISKDDEVLGTFAIYYPEPRQPSESDLELIEGAANIAVIAIEGERSQTALRKAFDEIKQSEARLRKIIDAIPTFAWCGLPDGSKEFFNQRWHDYTGLSPEEAHGWGWKVAIHPDDLEKLMDTWSVFVASGEPGEVEARIRRFDGQYRWFLFRAEPLRDEHGNVVNWYGTSTDIEDRKLAEEKLRQDEMELRQITDAIAQSIMVLAPDGTALYANQTVLDFSGLTIEDVMAADFRTRFFHPEDVEKLRDERRQALARGVPFENEQRARRKDGTYRWFLNHYNPQRNEQGQIIRWYATGTDIDDRKRAEEALRSENLALREEIDHASMFEEIIGSSKALHTALRQVAKV